MKQAGIQMPIWSRVMCRTQPSQRASDSFVIPMGFVGTWEVLEKVSKLYVIVTPQ